MKRPRSCDGRVAVAVAIAARRAPRSAPALSSANCQAFATTPARTSRRSSKAGKRTRTASFNFVFGYLNRNYEEEPEIPVGPNNCFSPGPADRGQPTHFYPRRQQFMFKVRVPADFGKQELVWTLTRAGRTEKAVAHLDARVGADARSSTARIAAGSLATR